MTPPKKYHLLSTYCVPRCAKDFLCFVLFILRMTLRPFIKESVKVHQGGHLSKVTQLGRHGTENQIQVSLSLDHPEPKGIQLHTCGRVDVWTCAQRVQGLGGYRRGRTDVIRVGHLLSGFTSNKDDSRETEAPHFPCLNSKARPKIGETGSI